MTKSIRLCLAVGVVALASVAEGSQGEGAGTGSGNMPEVRWETLAVVALAPAAQSAVLRLPDRTLAVVRVGQEIAGLGLLVRGVTNDRLVLEQRVTGDGPPRRRRIWMDRADADGRSRVRVLDPARPPQAEVSRVESLSPRAAEPDVSSAAAAHHVSPPPVQ